ncbi:sensor histidine kinase [Nocardia sp. NPDC049149]|uniref:sensor histidine kinase n=1 Tax=Nocardia sp. NPDC049149 TaxID=3364315 RepID=UPI0037169EEB
MTARGLAPVGWDFWVRIWAAYVVGGIIATAVLVIVLQHEFAGHMWTSLAALAGLLAWSALLAPRRSNPGAFTHRVVDRNSVSFVAVALVLFLIAAWWSPQANAGLMVIYALIYMSLPVRPAMLVAGAISLTPLVYSLISQLDVPMGLTISLIAVVFNPPIGGTIVLAIDRGEQLAVLLRQLESSRADVERLSREAGTAAERARLAREIHDTLTQGFTGIATLAQAVDSEFDSDPVVARRHIALIEATARENLIEARAMVEALTPPELGVGPLADSVRRRCERLTDETGISVHVEVDSTVPQLDTATEVVLLRVVQEALTNVRKHAHADCVHVTLTRTDQDVRLSVADNGIGFDLARTNGFGLSSLRSRAHEVGATVAVTTSPGAGTRVDIVVPT